METLILVAAAALLIAIVLVGLGMARRNGHLLLAANGLMLLTAVAAAYVTYSFWVTRDLSENWLALYIIIGVWPAGVVVLLACIAMLTGVRRLPAPEAGRVRIASLVNLGLMLAISLWGVVSVI